MEEGDLLKVVSRGRVSLGHDAVKGRCGYASRSLEAGQLLCSTRPFALCIATENIQTLCHECLEKPEHLLRCSGCRKAKYCSRECQVRGWKQHKEECSIWKQEALWKALSPFDPDDQSSFLLVIRVLINRERFQKSPEASIPYFQSWSNISSLCGTQWSPVPPSDRPFEFDQVTSTRLAESFSSLSGLFSFKEEYSMDFLVQLFLKMQKNNFQVVDENFRSLGSAVFPVGALLNHSCQPNCILMYQYDAEALCFVQHIRTLRRIAEGEELTHSYIDSGLVTNDRQSRLYQQFEFICSCSRCVRVSASCPDQILQGVLTEAERLQLGGLGAVDLSVADELYERASQETSPEQRVRLFEECLQLRMRNLHRLSLPVFMIWCRLLDAYMDTDSITKATEACERICECYEESGMYCQSDIPGETFQHPMIGLQYFTLGDLLCHQCRLQKASTGQIDPPLLFRARKAYERALVVLQISHGPQHPLVQNLQEQLL